MWSLIVLIAGTLIVAWLASQITPAFVARYMAPLLAGILLLAAWYLLSVRKVRGDGGQWAGGRTFAFIVLGLGFWTIAVMAWPGVYESALFYAAYGQQTVAQVKANLALRARVIEFALRAQRLRADELKAAFDAAFP